MKLFKFGIALSVGLLAFVTAATAQTVLRLGHNYQTSHAVHIATESLAKLVNEASGGDLQIVVYPAEQLGGLRAGAEGVQLGTIDIYAVDSGTLGNWKPEYSFVSLPFIFPDFDTAVAKMDALGPELTESMRGDLNVERLGWSPAGFRVMLSSNRPIAKAEDLKGLKIRVPEIPLYVSAFGALHANSTPLPWGDVYGALQTGVVEGVEGPAGAILATALNEVSTYMARTNHIMGDLNLLMNLDKFNSLTPEQQQILRDAAKQAFDGELRAATKVDEDTAYNKLAETLEENNTPDVGSFRDAMAPVYGEFIQTAGPKAEAWIKAAQAE